MASACGALCVRPHKQQGKGPQMDHLLALIVAQTEPAALGWLRNWVTEWKIHPVLVNFTAALIPVSVFSDVAARVFRSTSLRIVGFWTLLFAAVITPFTAAAGWLFWMPDDNGDPHMTIHKWLGTTAAVLLIGVFAWRATLQSKGRMPSWPYLVVGLIIVAAVIYQGHLGGDKSFGG